jgi:hypothetical protein
MFENRENLEDIAAKRQRQEELRLELDQFENYPGEN